MTISQFLLYPVTFLLIEFNFLKKITLRITNETSLDNLYQGLISENLSETIGVNDIEKSMVLIHDKISYNYNQNCPVKAKFISPKDQEKPWINYHLKNDMKKR